MWLRVLTCLPANYGCNNIRPPTGVYGGGRGLKFSILRVSSIDAFINDLYSEEPLDFAGHDMEITNHGLDLLQSSGVNNQVQFTVEAVSSNTSNNGYRGNNNGEDLVLSDTTSQMELDMGTSYNQIFEALDKELGITYAPIDMTQAPVLPSQIFVENNEELAFDASILDVGSERCTLDGYCKSQKKKRDAEEDEDDSELDNEDPSASKKPRVVWSVELHQQFVGAVSQLGIEKAVPKRILELMNVPGLTRENVASHLQKFRLYLKRLSEVPQQPSGLPNSMCGSIESNTRPGSLGRLDFQALVASGQIPPQTLAALQAELLGQSSGNLLLPAIDQPILRASMQGPKCISAELEIAFGQPLFKCQSSIPKQFPLVNITVEDMSSGHSMWLSDPLGAATSTSNIGKMKVQNSSMLVQELHQQQMFPVLSDSHQALNIQPSCSVVPSQTLNGSNLGKSSVLTNQFPSQSSNRFKMGNSSVAVTPSPNFNNIVVDYGLLSSQSDNALLCVGQHSIGDFKNMGVLTGYSIPGTHTSSVSSCSSRTNSSPAWRSLNSNANFCPGTKLPPYLPHLDIQDSEPKMGTLSDQGQVRNLGFVGKGTSIPSRFALDDIDSATNYHSFTTTCIGADEDRVKQEVLLDYKDSSKVGSTMLPLLSTDFMGVLSKDSLEGCFLKS